MTGQQPGSQTSERFGPGVTIEDDVVIGDYTILHPGTHIMRGARIGAFCELGIPSDLAHDRTLMIGPGALIRSHSVFYTGSRFGAGLRTGHRVTVRENIRAGDFLQIGTLSDLQGHCTIGDHVRLHSNVFIAQGAVIGSFVFLFPYVVLTDDPTPPSHDLQGVTIGDYAAIAASAVALPGAIIGAGALIGAMSLVKGVVPPDSVYVGNPGRIVGSTARIKLKNGDPAYPWRRHFHRGYPEDVVAGWKAEFA